MNELNTLSAFDLYFYSHMALGMLERQRKPIDAQLGRTRGKAWFAELGQAVKAYRAQVEKLITETGETTDSLKQLDLLMGQVGTWRRVMESLVRQAPPDRQAILLRAAGYGLGSPRSPKATKDFLLEVKVSGELHGDELRRLGASDRVLGLPSTTLVALEQQTTVVAREKAEDTLARQELKLGQARVLDAMRSVELATQQVAAEATLFGDVELARAAGEIEVELSKILAEARVQARQKAQTQPLPGELVETPPSVVTAPATTAPAVVDS